MILLPNLFEISAAAFLCRSSSGPSSSRFHLHVSEILRTASCNLCGFPMLLASLHSNATAMKKMTLARDDFKPRFVFWAKWIGDMSNCHITRQLPKTTAATGNSISQPSQASVVIRLFSTRTCRCYLQNPLHFDLQSTESTAC